MHTVLAVDDEPANQRAMRRALADDWRVLTAGSGAEALAVMATEPVALVVTDHRMPGMTGAAFLAETIARHPAVIRIVLTGFAETEVLLDAINRGHVYHVLCKPWEAQALRQLVRRGIERWEAAAERARLLEQVQAARRRAERAAEQKTRLLALAAHELGTPLHLLLNALALLREGGLPDGAAPWLDLAERAAEWLARGAAQLHTGARVGARALTVRPVPTDLHTLAAQVAAAVRVAARERRLTIVTEPGAVTASGDAHWLAQALTALLSNAVRATPDGGRITVTARRDGAWAELAVCDSGVGMTAAQLAEAFEPFSVAGGELLWHGSGRFAFGARGLGLGLATVHGIATAHGGTVTIDSAPGQGTTVRLRLPE